MMQPHGEGFSAVCLLAPSGFKYKQNEFVNSQAQKGHFSFFSSNQLKICSIPYLPGWHQVPYQVSLGLILYSVCKYLRLTGSLGNRQGGSS